VETRCLPLNAQGEFRLDGKTAIITGGGSDIGRAIALMFAASGAAVRILDVNLNDAESIAKEITAAGGSASAYACDVGNQKEVTSAFGSIAQRGRIRHSRQQCRHLPDRKRRSHARRRLRSHHVCEREGLLQLHSCQHRHMKGQGGGSVLNIASVAGSAGVADRFGYSTSKGAIIAMTYSVARDYLAHNIRCNCISPARVHTSFVDGYLKKNYPGREKEMYERAGKSAAYRTHGKTGRSRLAGIIPVLRCGRVYHRYGLHPRRRLYEIARVSATKVAYDVRPTTYGGFMDLELKNKVVLVTGGAKGIGAAIVRGAAAEGAIPDIVDKDVKARNALHPQLSGSELVIADLSSPESCDAAIDHATRKFNRLDALVNNAGVNDKIGLEYDTPQKYVESLERNLLHYYNMAHFALPHLKKSRGSIVNIASKTALTGQGGTSGYASAKGAILALTREWAAELADYGIRVNAIVPAEVMTPLYQQWLDTFPEPQEKLKSILAKIPLEKRMTAPEEIAAMVLFLLSARAPHITAQHTFVDGGYVHLDRALT